MECPICLTSAKGEFKIKTPCNHAFCFRCFLKLPNTLCPMCRQDFKNELPGYLKRHFETKEALEKINIPLVSNVIDISDEYEFPPLG